MADSMNEKDYSKFKVADLKKELKTRGLSTVGNKHELIERLTLAVGDMLANDGIVDDTDDILDHDDVDDDSAAEDIAGDEEEVLGQSIEEEEDLGPEEHNTPDVESAASQVATSQELSASGLRKIVLKRRPTTPPAVSDPDQSVPELDAPAAPTASKTVKLSHLSSAERLELRAQKFGTPITSQSRKELRAVRFGDSDQIHLQTSSTEVMKKRAERFGLTKDINSSSDVLKKRAERFGTSASDVSDKNSSDILKRRAERFGTSATDASEKVELDEKIKKRQQRFGIVAINEERKKLRTERFKVK